MVAMERERVTVTGEVSIMFCSLTQAPVPGTEVIHWTAFLIFAMFDLYQTQIISSTYTNTTIYICNNA